MTTTSKPHPGDRTPELPEPATTTTTHTAPEPLEVPAPVAEAKAEALSYAERLEQATSEANMKAAEVRAELLALNAELVELKQAAERAESEPDQIVKGWTSGTSEATAEEHAHAESEALRARVQYQGACVRRERLERNLRPTDAGAASVVARIIEEALHGYVPALVTTAEIIDAPDATELPVVVVRQVTESTRNGLGSVAGEVEATYFRSPVHLPLSRHQIEDAADDLGMDVSIKWGTGESPQIFKIKLMRGWESAPLIPELSDDLRAIATNITASVATMGNPDRAARAVNVEAGRVPTLEGEFHTATPLGATLESEDVADDGTRTTVLSVKVGVDRRNRGLGHSGPADTDTLLRGVISRMDGQFLSGLGVVTGVERRSLAHKSHPDAVELLVTLTSRI